MLLALNNWINGNLLRFGLTLPTPVQCSCIPAILQGRDVIATSQTGSGKTAAFALPIIQLLSEEPHGVFCLCLTPTRELATQIMEQFIAFSPGMTLRCLCTIGGENNRTQAIALVSRPHVVVSTPGRLMEHLLHDDDKSIAKCFANLRFLVLDEGRQITGIQASKMICESSCIIFLVIIAKRYFSLRQSHDRFLLCKR